MPLSMSWSWRRGQRRSGGGGADGASAAEVPCSWGCNAVSADQLMALVVMHDLIAVPTAGQPLKVSGA